MELKECSQSEEKQRREIKPDFCLQTQNRSSDRVVSSSHRVFFQIHMESLIRHQQEMKEKTAPRVHTADLTGQPLHALFAIPLSLALQD